MLWYITYMLHDGHLEARDSERVALHDLLGSILPPMFSITPQQQASHSRQEDDGLCALEATVAEVNKCGTPHMWQRLQCKAPKSLHMRVCCLSSLRLRPWHEKPWPSYVLDSRVHNLPTNCILQAVTPHSFVNPKWKLLRPHWFPSACKQRWTLLRNSDPKLGALESAPAKVEQTFCCGSGWEAMPCLLCMDGYRKADLNKTFVVHARERFMLDVPRPNVHQHRYVHMPLWKISSLMFPHFHEYRYEYRKLVASIPQTRSHFRLTLSATEAQTQPN